MRWKLPRDTTRRYYWKWSAAERTGITFSTMKTLTIRTDDEVEQALHVHTSGGQSRSAAAWAAILQAERAYRRAQLRARPKVCAMILKTWPPRENWPPRWTPSVRGDIYQLRAPKDGRGHEQAGTRYAVIVQSDDFPLSTCLMAPTSTERRSESFRPEIDIDGTTTRVMAEQLTVIDPQTRLGEFAGRLSSAELRALDAALAVILALD